MTSVSNETADDNTSDNNMIAESALDRFGNAIQKHIFGNIANMLNIPN